MSTFEEKGLSEEILKAIGELGFVNPTPIQEKTLPAILESGTDLIALAQTGTGKTAGFGLPILQQTVTSSKHVQALILSPTRELCLQIAEDLKRFSKYIKGLKVEAVYGGASIVPQLKALKDGPQIVVGTPGRTLDLIKRKALKVSQLNWMVLDEADEMLNMGFKDDLDAILQDTPAEKQTLLFSATMPQGVRRIANNYMNSPEEISVGKKNQGNENIAHQYFVVRASDRYPALKRIADMNPDIYGIVFCRTRRETKEVADHLIQDGYNADALHGDLSQAQRDHVMQRFRKRNLQLLIATDVAARGLDVNELTHVINYNLPDDPEVYVHRSGRTGRAGNKGVSITISHSREGRRIKELEKQVGKKFEPKKVPGGREICEKRLFNLIDRMEQVSIDEEQIGEFLPAIEKKLEGLDREELLKRFISIEFNRFLEYYKDAGDLNVDQEGRRDKDRKEKTKRRGDGGFTRFYINLGSKHNMSATNLMGLINEATGDKNIEIGKIDMLRKFSFFEVEQGAEQKIINGFANAVVEGEAIEVQISKPEPQGDRPEKKRKPSGGYQGKRGGSSNRGGSSSSRGGSYGRSSSSSRSRSDSYKGGSSRSDSYKGSSSRKKRK